MQKYNITPELASYVNSLQLATSHVDMFIVAINYVLASDNQSKIMNQDDLNVFFSLLNKFEKT